MSFDDIRAATAAMISAAPSKVQVSWDFGAWGSGLGATISVLSGVLYSSVYVQFLLGDLGCSLRVGV